MKQATRVATNTPSIPPGSLAKRLYEAAAIILFAVAAFLLLSLITYHRSDPGWSSTGIGSQIQNAGGMIGAWISDFLLYLFGYMAYLFPLMLVYAAWLACRGPERSETFSGLMIGLRTGGFLLILLTGSGLVSLHLPDAPNFLPFNAGGILGTVIGTEFARAFNPIGTSLLLTALLLIGITLFTSISWLAVVDGIGRGLIFAARYSAQLSMQLVMQVLRVLKNILRKPAACTAPMQIHAEPTAAPPIRPTSHTPTPIVAKNRKTEKRPKPIGAMPTIELLDQPDPHKAPGYSAEQLEQMSRDMELHLQVNFTL